MADPPSGRSSQGNAQRARAVQCVDILHAVVAFQILLAGTGKSVTVVETVAEAQPSTLFCTYCYY